MLYNISRNYRTSVHSQLSLENFIKSIFFGTSQNCHALLSLLNVDEHLDYFGFRAHHRLHMYMYMYGIRTSFFSRIDAKNKPAAILIEKGTVNIRETASQEWCLLTLLPFMIGKYIPQGYVRQYEDVADHTFALSNSFRAKPFQIIFLFSVDDAVFVIIHPKCRSKPTIYTYC